jgi:hypothetical protein
MNPLAISLLIESGVFTGTCLDQYGNPMTTGITWAMTTSDATVVAPGAVTGNTIAYNAPGANGSACSLTVTATDANGNVATQVYNITLAEAASVATSIVGSFSTAVATSVAASTEAAKK